MSKEFEMQYLSKWHVDEEYELYLQAWQAYHKAANIVDGRLRNCFENLALTHMAVRAGTTALNDYLAEHHCIRPTYKEKDSWKKWQAAKLEAAREKQNN